MVLKTVQFRVLLVSDRSSRCRYGIWRFDPAVSSYDFHRITSRESPYKNEKGFLC